MLKAYQRTLVARVRYGTLLCLNHKPVFTLLRLAATLPLSFRPLPNLVLRPNQAAWKTQRLSLSRFNSSAKSADSVT